MESNMSKIEFETIIHKGTIDLPKEYIQKVQGKVRVIIVTDEEEDDIDMVEYLMEHPLVGSDSVPLTRDEVYDRSH